MIEGWRDTPLDQGATKYCIYLFPAYCEFKMVSWLPSSSLMGGAESQEKADFAVIGDELRLGRMSDCFLLRTRGNLSTSFGQGSGGCQECGVEVSLLFSQGHLGLTCSPGRLVGLLPCDEIWATWTSECVEGSQTRREQVQRLRGKEVDGLFGT